MIIEEVTSASDRMEVRKQGAIVPHRYILHRFPLRIFAVGSFRVAAAVAVAALLAADTCAIRLVGRVSFLAFLTKAVVNVVVVFRVICTECFFRLWSSFLWRLRIFRSRRSTAFLFLGGCCPLPLRTPLSYDASSRFVRRLNHLSNCRCCHHLPYRTFGLAAAATFACLRTSACSSPNTASRVDFYLHEKIADVRCVPRNRCFRLTGTDFGCSRRAYTIALDDVLHTLATEGGVIPKIFEASNRSSSDSRRPLRVPLFFDGRSIVIVDSDARMPPDGDFRLCASTVRHRLRLVLFVVVAAFHPRRLSLFSERILWR